MKRKPPASERLLKMEEVAEILSVSRQTAERRFENRPATKFLGRREATREKQRYRMMRVPESDLAAYLKEVSA